MTENARYIRANPSRRKTIEDIWSRIPIMLKEEGSKKIIIAKHLK